MHTTSRNEHVPGFQGGGASTFNFTKTQGASTWKLCYDLEHVKINMGLSRGHISSSNFHNLVSVNISRCRFLDLTWLIYASSLKMLWVC